LFSLGGEPGFGIEGLPLRVKDSWCTFWDSGFSRVQGVGMRFKGVGTVVCGFVFMVSVIGCRINSRVKDLWCTFWD
jgi:hypothetical protein